MTLRLHTFFQMDLHIVLEFKELATSWTDGRATRWPVHVLVGGADKL